MKNENVEKVVEVMMEAQINEITVRLSPVVNEFGIFKAISKLNLKSEKDSIRKAVDKIFALEDSGIDKVTQEQVEKLSNTYVGIISTRVIKNLTAVEGEKLAMDIIKIMMGI